MNRQKNKKAQEILGYAFLVVVIIAVFVAMAILVKRRIQGGYKRAADTFGQEEQYQPFGGTIEVQSPPQGLSVDLPGDLPQLPESDIPKAEPPATYSPEEQ